MENVSNVENEEIVKFRQAQNKSCDYRGVDGCYAWFIVAMSFLIYIISGGACFTGGLILPELLVAFPDTDEASASLVVSMTTALMQFSALYAGCFCEVYGWRSVCAAGSFMISLGYFTSSFVKSISTLYFTYSILIGVGLGFQFVPCIVIIQSYFTKKRTLASSIVSSGSSVGVFIFAVLIRSLIDVYAWRGALLVVAAITLNALPFTIFLVSPITSESNSSDDEIANTNTKRTNNSRNGASNFLTSFKMLLKSLRKVALTLLKSGKDLAEPEFSLTCLAQVLKALETGVPYVMLPIKLLLLEYSNWQVAALVAVMGAGDLVGRLLVGIQSTICNFNKILFFASALLVAGLTEVMTGLITNYYGLCICAFCTAMCGGLIISSTPPLLVDLVGMDRLPRSFGLICTGQGIGSLIGLPLQAVIYEVSGNINIPFFACGAFPVLESILMIFVFVLHKRSKKISSGS